MSSTYELEGGALGKSTWEIMSWSKLEDYGGKLRGMGWRHKIGVISIG